MPTNYPGAIDSYSNKVDGVTDVLAADTNNLQDAMVAVQNRLGTTGSPNIVLAAGAQSIAGVKTFAENPVIRTNSPTLFLRDTDEMSAMLHCNGNLLYVLRGGVDTTTWTQINGQWPLIINLANNDMTCGGNFSAVGNVSAYSDERLKANWRPLPADFLTRFAAVKHGAYERTDTEATQVGVSAQSLREVMPEAVMEGSDGMLSVSYGNAALAACVELAKEVMSLRAEIAALKSKVGG